MSDDQERVTVAWIYTYERPSGHLISARRATEEERRALQACRPAPEEPPPLPAPGGSPPCVPSFRYELNDTPSSLGDGGGGRTVTYTV